MINYRPFYILGEVGQPGEYPYTNGLTVQNAVAAAGGYTYRANKRVVYIKSIESDREIAYDLTPGTVVKPGDTLRIGERIFSLPAPLRQYVSRRCRPLRRLFCIRRRSRREQTRKRRLPYLPRESLFCTVPGQRRRFVDAIFNEYFPRQVKIPVFA